MAREDGTPRPAAKLKLKCLDGPQRALWKELGDTPAQFILYGGTALALQLGHRKSIDFDFFSQQKFDAQRLLETVPYLAGARITQLAPGTLTVILHRQADIKVSYFAPERPLHHIGDPVTVTRPRLRLASKIDIAATKIVVIAARPAAKDYPDIDALMTKGKVPLLTQLAAVPFVFPDRDFNPYVPLKALTYFEDGDLPSLPAPVRRRLALAATRINPADVLWRIEAARADPRLWSQL